MEFQEILKKAKAIQKQYKKLNKEKGNRKWETGEYLQGLVGDIGELSQLIMSKNNYRNDSWTKEQIEHELSDCLWSIMAIANELDIDLEKSFLETMNELEQKIRKNKR